ncbi:MAG: bifunctional riboflavin kinase/FAD synthetase [Chlorobi bacterium]|nr:bifunctional riboflavin kinase/FAD synthetase [Chlorobiota bacterium]
MNIYKNINEIKFDVNTAVTIGTFDGLHLGHRQIFETLFSKAKETGGRNFVVTFEPHPRTIVNSGSKVNLLTLFDEKIHLFEEMGVENVLIINFTKEFASTEYGEFIEKYLIHGIGTNNVVVGYDHKFGKNRGGNEEYLRTFGEKNNFDVTVVPPFSVEGTTVSSSLIRKVLLNGGNVELAEKYLGRYYLLRGNVIHGLSRGHEIGFPTANIIPLHINKLVPENGVYLVGAKVEDKTFYGVMNIGTRPTFENGEDIHLEIHILGFDRNIYNKEVCVNFIKRIRDERKFDSVDDLKNQIKNDIKKAENFITQITN